MARGRNKLTAAAARAAKRPGRHADGDGLFLDVTPAGAKSWVLVYRSPVHRAERKGKLVGRTREMGLGPFGEDTKSGRVTLAAARLLADEARRLLAQRLDPLDERNRPAEVAERIPTFGEMADQFIIAMSPGWSNPKHREQWQMTLREYAKPLRDKPVDEITVADVLAVLKPHWERRPETAGRLRGRIERVLNAAKAAGHRTGENPAAWRGHLENLLPARAKLSRGHHAAMAWADVPAFMARLRQREGIAALAVEFTILTAARSGEVRGATWGEVDTAAAVWTVPAKRMKAGREHRVPLVPRAVEIVAEMAKLAEATGEKQPDALVFPGMKRGAPLIDMSLSAVLRRMKVGAVTVHGFRSAFKDWANETTSFPNELSEAALAHLTGDAVERAYRRGDALDRRRELMAAWAGFCAGPAAANVVALRKAVA